MLPPSPAEMPEDLQHISQLTCLKGVIVAASAAWLRNVSAAKSYGKRSQIPIS